MSKNESKYIGEKEVTGFTELEGQRTPAGATIVRVDYKDSTSETMPYPRYEALIHTEKLDASKTRDRVVARVAGTIYGVLHEYGMYLNEIDPVINQLVTLVNGAVEKANNYKWGVEFADQRSLLMVNDVLIKANTNGTSSTGGGSNKQDQN